MAWAPGSVSADTTMASKSGSVAHSGGSCRGKWTGPARQEDEAGQRAAKTAAVEAEAVVRSIPELMGTSPPRKFVSGNHPAQPSPAQPRPDQPRPAQPSQGPTLGSVSGPATTTADGLTICMYPTAAAARSSYPASSSLFFLFASSASAAGKERAGNAGRGKVCKGEGAIGSPRGG